MKTLNNAKGYSITVFVDRDLVVALQEVVNWLQQGHEIEINSGNMFRNNSFYFSGMNVSYDGEFGYVVEIYHSEIR